MYSLKRPDQRTFLIYIDSYRNQVPTGRLHSPWLGEYAVFHSLTQLLLKIEEYLDIHNNPQAFHNIRLFCPHSDMPAPAYGISTRRGDAASFRLEVHFRRNCSWQGSLCWLEAEQTHHFRSTLELIRLLHSALSGSSSFLEPDVTVSHG